MANTTIIERVRRLQALSQSTNANEAAVAAATAAKLIAEHNLAEAELELTGGVAAEACSEDAQAMYEWDKLPPAWSEALAHAVAETNDVALFRRRSQTSTYVALRMVGRTSDTATARTMYIWLHAEIERLAKDAGRGRGARWTTSFRIGAVRGVQDAMREAKRYVSARAVTPGQAAAAIVLAGRHDHALARLTELHPRLRTAPTRKATIGRDAYDEGLRAGKAIDVTGARTPRLTASR